MLLRVGLLPLALAAMVVLLVPGRAEARIDGIFNSSSCSSSVCHADGSTDTTLSANFPTNALVGQQYTVTLTVTNSGMPEAGFSLAVDDGTLSNPTGGSQINASNLSATHTEPSTTKSWTVRWTAPPDPGDVSFTFMGNAVNANDARTGDEPAASSLTRTIHVYIAPGDICDGDDECQSGFCTDSRCCDDRCDGSCEACSAAAGSQSGNGVCDTLEEGYSAQCCPSGGYWTGSACESGCQADLDNCSDDPPACVPEDDDPFYRCECPSPGWEGDGVGANGCSDIDECDPDPCGPGLCVEEDVGTTAEGYHCECDPGYRAPTLGGTCVNINECADMPPESPPYDGFAACAPGMCNEEPPGMFWTCDCPPTHELFNRPGDGREICDFNECLVPEMSRCDANATCTNTIGSNTCACNMGYEDRDPLATPGTVCDDIDECARDLDTCDPNAMCMNLDGSYMCTCLSGYEGSGFACTDIDECRDGTGGCEVNELCVNNVGAPNDCVCVPGTSRETDDAPCTVRCGDGLIGQGEECDDGNVAMDDGCSPTCAIEDGWACFEPTGEASVCMETCGDGLVDEAEECDDGAANDDDLADACRTTCQLPSCGDGTVDTGEECDDGAGNDDDLTDGCRTTCHEAYCGDGVLDTGETCDSGGGLPGASVAGQCTTLCFPDAGIDPDNPPILTGGACSCRAASGSPSGRAALLLGLGLALLLGARRRRR